MNVIVEISARHLHLSQEHLDILFGAGYQLTAKKALSQPGQFACEEKVEVVDKATGRYLKTIWRQKFGADNHAFDTRVYNKGALEIFADDICRQELRCGALDWNAFWRYAKDFKAFYRDAD